ARGHGGGRACPRARTLLLDPRGRGLRTTPAGCHRLAMLTARIEKLRLSAGAQVLDIGCGEGRHCHGVQLLSKAQAIGVDLHEPSLALARGRAEDIEGAGPRAQFLTGDASALPFDDAAFDAAICSEVLEHVPDMAAVVREAAR